MHVFRTGGYKSPIRMERRAKEGLGGMSLRCMPYLQESDGGSALPPITASAGGELSMGSHGREDDYVGLATLRTHERGGGVI